MSYMEKIPMGKKFDEIKNQKHKEFILAYIELQNATLAYKKAYPTAKYSTCGQNGAKLLKDTKTAEAIQEIFDDLWNEKKKEIGTTFKNLLALANADIKDIADFDGETLKIKPFSEADTRAIQSIDTIERETKYGPEKISKVRMHSKTAALSDLLKVLEMMQDKSELTGEIIVRPARRPNEEKNEIEKES